MEGPMRGPVLWSLGEMIKLKCLPEIFIHSPSKYLLRIDTCFFIKDK